MTTISDLTVFMLCLKCGHRGKDFTYIETTEKVYLVNKTGGKKISSDNEKDWAYKCPKCGGTWTAFYFKGGKGE